MFKRLFRAFENKNRHLYHVGGSVRDTLLGKPPKDFDFTTDALPEETKAIVKKMGLKTFPLGEKFGTIATRIKGLQIEITTHRRDVTSGRHPDVAFTTSLKEDLSRRDFTINSMAKGMDGKVIDYFGGFNHIEARLIKTTGNPMHRFAEDPLRMLRAIRFVSKLGFNLEYRTKRAIFVSAQAIVSISKERLLDEMNKLLTGSFAGRALELLLQTRLLGYILPEVFPITLKHSGKLLSKDLWQHTKVVVVRSKADLIVRWAALLHDIAKPQTRQEVVKKGKTKKVNYGTVHFFQHEHLGAEMVDNIAKRLRMSNDMRSEIRGLVAMHHRIGDVVSRRNNPPVSRNALRRIATDCDNAKCCIEDLVELFMADCSSVKKSIQDRQMVHAKLLREAIANMREEDLRPKLPSGVGKLIMEHFKLSPGPEVGRLRKELNQMLLDGKLNADSNPAEMVEKLKGSIIIKGSKRVVKKKRTHKKEVRK